MTDYLYDSHGNAVGYIRGKYIHKLSGQAIGQINGTCPQIVRIICR